MHDLELYLKRLLGLTDDLISEKVIGDFLFVFDGNHTSLFLFPRYKKIKFFIELQPILMTMTFNDHNSRDASTFGSNPLTNLRDDIQRTDRRGENNTPPQFFAGGVFCIKPLAVKYVV